MGIISNFKVYQNQNQSQFKIEILPEYIQRELFYTISILDQPKLLLINKKYRAIFLPFMWENIRFDKCEIVSKELKRLFKRYSYLIKFLDLTSCNKIEYSEVVYRNAKYLKTSIENVITNNLFNLSAKLIELSFDCRIYNLNLKEYILVNGISLSSLLDRVKCLNIYIIDDNLIENILPLLPSCINQINIQFGITNGISIKKLLNRFSELIHFSINYDFFSFETLKFFESFYFMKLQSLEIRCRKLTERVIIIPAEQIPQLSRLVCTYVNIEFNGKSNIRELLIKGAYLSKFNLTKENLPKVRILKLEKSHNFSFKLIKDILNLPSLTSLSMGSYNISYIMLLDKLYPKKPNHLIELNLLNFYIDEKFYEFLFNCCRKLTHLSIVMGIKYYSQSFSNLLSKSNYTSTSTLEIQYLNVFYCDQRFNSLIKQVIAKSPKLCTLKVFNNIPDDLNPKMIEKKYIENLSFK